MKQRPWKILLVEPDADIVDVLVGTLSQRLNAQITCVADADDALEVDMFTPHDLVLTDLDLPGSSGLTLVGYLTSLSTRPVILLADDPSVETVIEAMRLGVRDIFCKPFSVGDLLDAAERLLRGFEVRRAHQAKYHHMRELVRRVIRERRDLRRRIELLCRDLVGAHRRLVQRVLENESLQSANPSSMIHHN